MNAFEPAGVADETLEPGEGLAAPLDDELRAGSLLHQYQLLRELGRGGMGRVFLARDRKLARLVAIKLLRSPSAEATERFLAEARATARCSHENIVVLHDVSEHRGKPFLVLEHLRGVTLAEQLAPGRPMASVRAVTLMAPVVRALVAAHELGIVHRDLKPANIFVCASGLIKVLDFGVAQLYERPRPGGAGASPEPHGDPQGRWDDQGPSEEDPRSARSPGAISGPILGRGPVGTPAYMAPEQWRPGTVDARTDLFAVGLILYEMVAGTHPLSGLPPEQLALEVGGRDRPMPRVGAAVPELPGDLERVIDRCLQKDPDARFPSAQALLDALEPLLPARPGGRLRDDEPPYPGLTAFGETDAARFFGRSREIDRLVTSLRDRALVAVAGPSGVGKTSLLRAGLVAALKGSGEPWEVLTVRPGRRPVDGLAGLLRCNSTPTPSPGAGAEEPGRDLASQLRAEPGTFGERLRSWAARRSGSVLLLVDQLEELYTLEQDAEERRTFTACLAGASDDAAAPVRVVLAIRSDFLDRLAEDEAFLDSVTRGLVFLKAPERPSLREAITAPAEMAGYHLEDPELVDEMLASLEQESGALPLLQFAAARLWELRDRGRKLLTRASYQAIGGVAGALASHADEVLAALAPADRTLARAILLRLVTAEGTRAVAELDELAGLAKDRGAARRVLDALLSARLIVVQTRGSEEQPVAELVHESLIENWPALARWLEESRGDVVFLEQLRSAARQWEAHGRPQGMLWRGEAEEMARRFVHRHKGSLSPMEQVFLDAVFTLASRAARLRRRLIGGVITVLALLVVAGTVAIIQIRRAERRAVEQAALAKREAERARSAEGRVLRQIELIRAERAAKRAAEREASRAKTEVVAKQERLVSAEDKLKLSREELERSLVRLRAEKVRAEQALVAARAAARQAEQAGSELAKALGRERLAKERYQRLHREEQARVRALLEQRRKIEVDLK